MQLWHQGGFVQWVQSPLHQSDKGKVCNPMARVKRMGKTLPGMANPIACSPKPGWPWTPVKCYKGSTNLRSPLVARLRIRKGCQSKGCLERQEKLASIHAWNNPSKC